VAVKEKLQEYALLAEITGGIAIVLSLVFVGLQIRETNTLNRVEAYDRNIESLMSIRSDVFRDPEMTRMYLIYMYGDVRTLSEADQFRISHLTRNTFGNYEKAYYSYSLGIMGAPEWTRYERNICTQKERLDRNDMVDGVNGVFDVLSTEFQDYILALCD
jgi:hypothetical protein